MILTNATELILKPRNSTAIDKARELQRDADVHFTGNKYLDLLTQLTDHETVEQWQKKRELGEPVTKPLCENIQRELSRFVSSGSRIQYIDFGKASSEKKQYEDTLKKCYAGTSLQNFSHTWLLPALFYRFNDFIVVTRPAVQGDMAIVAGIPMPVEEAPRKYVVTVSIADVWDYQKTGDRVEYLIYKYGKDADGNDLYRVIDDATDTVYIRRGQDVYIRIADGRPDVLKHSKIPARQVGCLYADINSSLVCKSEIDACIPLLRRLIKFDAINTISEIKTSFPLWWLIGNRCDADGCDNGYVISEGEKTKCKVCNGTGMKSNVSPGNAFVIPASLLETERPLTSAPAGIVQGDTNVVRYQADRLNERIEEIYQYALGMQPLAEIQRTATEVEINAKPLEDRNNIVSSHLEKIERWICDTIAADTFSRDYMGVTITYSKRLNLRNENTIAEEIKKAKENGSTQSYIYSLVEEQIYSKYSNDPIERERQLRLLQLEPLPGYTIDEVANMAHVDNITKYIKQNFSKLLDEVLVKQNKPIEAIETKVMYELLVAEAQENTGEEKVMLSSVIGVGGTQSMQMIMTDPVLPEAQKKGMLKVLFNLSEEDISLIFPSGDTPINITPNSNKNDETEE